MNYGWRMNNFLKLCWSWRTLSERTVLAGNWSWNKRTTNRKYIKSLVKHVVSSIGQELQERHHEQSFNKQRIPSIVVQFQNRPQRDSWLTGFRQIHLGMKPATWTFSTLFGTVCANRLETFLFKSLLSLHLHI